jgi:adenylate cyclase class 2
MKAARTIETEIKLAAGDAAHARSVLRRAGFRVHKRRIFEDNFLLDTAGQRLRKAGELLRVRQAGREYTVTYKGKGSPGRHKSREELEATVSDFHTMVAIADRLGLQPMFRYQKYRTEYREDGRSGTATLDETPIGVYMELEGSPAWIDRTARRLGFREQDYITATYGELYLEWCRAHRARPAHMVF